MTTPHPKRHFSKINPIANTTEYLGGWARLKRIVCAVQHKKTKVDNSKSAIQRAAESYQAEANFRRYNAIRRARGKKPLFYNEESLARQKKFDQKQKENQK